LGLGDRAGREGGGETVSGTVSAGQRPVLNCEVSACVFLLCDGRYGTLYESNGSQGYLSGVHCDQRRNPGKGRLWRNSRRGSIQTHGESRTSKDGIAVL